MKFFVKHCKHSEGVTVTVLSIIVGGQWGPRCSSHFHTPSSIRRHFCLYALGSEVLGGDALWPFFSCSDFSHLLVPLQPGLCRRQRDSEGSSSPAPRSPRLAAGEDTGWGTTRPRGTSCRNLSSVRGHPGPVLEGRGGGSPLQGAQRVGGSRPGVACLTRLWLSLQA